MSGAVFDARLPTRGTAMKQLPSKLTALVSGMVLGVGLVAALQADPSPVIDGCVVRIYSTGPEIYANASHICTGVISVGWDPQTPTSLRIVQTPGFTAVKSVTVQEDNSIARDVSCGPSGGIGVTVVTCWDLQTGARRRPPAGSTNNFFFEWVRVP